MAVISYDCSSLPRRTFGIEASSQCSPESRELLDDSAERLGLSARAYHRVIKIARTIADLEGAKEVEGKHILEAIQYRPKVSN